MFKSTLSCAVAVILAILGLTACSSQSEKPTAIETKSTTGQKVTPTDPSPTVVEPASEATPTDPSPTMIEPMPEATPADPPPATPEPTSTEAPGLAASLPDLGPAPDLTNEVWINNETPLTLEMLRGKVVLIEFWTYG